ncbi:hypothetical protein [Calothrix sp. NIES-3974]|uniref:hypothetical protein n=1 Tax=Calothrix sp. NIES-3974 TaxID=2005462 RepID=UPI000B5DCF8F|nr:hypothetical protein [Calothrix sp. NIES-3974]BAZ05131.1 hypothetical protein NIES3974_17770 [Calothrix sp. NIES-3974]
MRYITSVERIATEEGLQQGTKQGLIKGIALGLKLNFGDAGTDLLPEIEEIGDVDILSAVLDAIESVDTVEQLRQVYRSNS